ncbi:MAG: Crp/Fnr family transcriptional regulator [Peptoniphilus sp.]|nr:Crp/Fnr family transcriptional regulator [Peptoniphilus sp.]MDD7363479.1 Crp/Fnr family transcriptional regulator [Bacillota bacterium]MDY6044817.1 Crp/Fnr family transcriptional regulator [Peptoniphilus sp.]
MNFSDLFSDKRLRGRRRFRKGERLLDPDSEHYAIILLESGTVEVSRYDISGARLLQNFMSAPQCFGLIESFAEAPLLSGIRALSDGTFYALSPDDALFEDKAFLTLMLTYVSSLYEEDIRRSVFEKRMSGRERVLFTIFRMTRPPFPYTLPLKREDLADLLGIARRSLYRYLSELEEEGFLARKGGKIVISEAAYDAMGDVFGAL